MAQNTAGFNFSNDPSLPSSDVNAENLKKLVEEATIYKIGPNAVTSGHLSPNIAGAGIGGGGGSALYVKPDGRTVEISSDAIQVKDGGIDTQHLKDRAITLDKLADAVRTQINSVLRDMYSVGDFFITRNATFNPASRFGGQWELLKDRFLLGAGGEYDLMATGGEKEHVLTIDEMPRHSHNINHIQRGDSDNSGDDAVLKSGKFNYNTDEVGGGEAHNNMPPYVAVNIWVKISDEDGE